MIQNMKIPISNCICLLITTFEQIFLNGLWASWGMMANILKREGYFEDACKPSEIEEKFQIIHLKFRERPNLSSI